MDEKDTNWDCRFFFLQQSFSTLGFRFSLAECYFSRGEKSPFLSIPSMIPDRNQSWV